jgi:hypothetical protein
MYGISFDSGRGSKGPPFPSEVELLAAITSDLEKYDAIADAQESVSIVIM